MMTGKAEEKGSADKDDYTQDGTADLKGRPILRSKTGRWNACSFIVGKDKAGGIAFVCGIEAWLVGRRNGFEFFIFHFDVY